MARLKDLHLEWYMVYQHIGTISSRPYYLPYVAFREYGDYFDSLGNLLAILLGVADADRQRQILRYLRQVGADQPFPVRAIHPPIFPWRQRLARVLSQPQPEPAYQYHNGGIWPFVGGFYVATLVHTGRLEEARRQLHQLARANQQGLEEEWEFNEWLHGRLVCRWATGVRHGAQACTCSPMPPCAPGACHPWCPQISNPMSTRV